MEMTMRNRDSALRLLLLAVAALLCLATVSWARKVSVGFSSFDFPGSSFTEAGAITPSGVIAGSYFTPADGRQHGFVLRDGVFTAVDVPGAVSTFVGWINAGGDIVGNYNSSFSEPVHGYVFSGGTFTTFDFPSANPVCTAGSTHRVGAGKVKCRKCPPAEHIAVHRLAEAGVIVSHDVATGVDPANEGRNGARNINGGENAVA